MRGTRACTATIVSHVRYVSSMPQHAQRGRRGRRQKARVTLNDLELQADRRRRDSSWTTLATTSGAVARQSDGRAKHGRAAEERRQRRRDMRAERELRRLPRAEEPGEEEVSFAHAVFSRHAAQFAATGHLVLPLQEEVAGPVELLGLEAAR